MSSSSDEVIVYWSPNYLVDQEVPIDWTLMYRTPERIEDSNVFRLKTTVGVDYFYDLKSFEFKSNIETYIGGKNEGDLEGKNLILTLNAGWLFFSEESITMSIKNPDIKHSPHVSQGVLEETSYDVSTWFRAVDTKFSLVDGQKKFSFDREEPLAEIEFLTDKKVVLKRFEVTDSILHFRNACIRSSILFDETFSREDLEKLFIDTQMNSLVLKHIKNNLV